MPPGVRPGGEGRESFKEYFLAVIIPHMTAGIKGVNLMSEDMAMYDVCELQHHKEPLPESLEHKCQRLTELIEEIVIETSAIGMMADFSAMGNLKIRVQMLGSDFDRTFAGMDTHVKPTSDATHLERYIDIGGVTFFTLVWETPAERAARMLRDLPEEERRRVLESMVG